MPRRPLMVRAALLRRSCDGVAAATELRRPLLLRVASRRDALNEEPASFPPGLIQISMVVAHSPRPPPWPRDKNERGRRLGTYLRRFLPCTGTMLETTFLKDSECRPNVLTLDWPKPYVLTLEFRPPRSWRAAPPPTDHSTHSGSGALALSSVWPGGAYTGT